MRKTIKFWVNLGLFGFLSLSGLLFGWMFFQINEKGHYIESLVQNILPAISNSVEVQSQLNLLKASQAILLSSDQQLVTHSIEESDNILNSLQIYISQLSSNASDHSEDIKNFNTSWENIIKLHPLYVIEVRNQDTAKANNLLKKLINEHKIASEHLKKISDNIFQKGLIDAQSIIEKEHLHKTLNISLFILFFITLLTAGLILTSKIISRLKTTSSTLQVSDQKLSVVADELKNTGNQLVEFGSLTSAALTQISSSINEINSMSKLNTSNLNEANLFAQNAKKDVNQALDKNAQLINQVNQVSQQSKEIENIVSFIEDIAFQTNLLALNAAVEAARAGDHGKGFAVVADAVRSLASKSSQSASEISKLVKNSQILIDESVDIANKSNVAFNQIVHKVNTIVESVNQCTHAIHEQSLGINQIDAALVEFEKSVQNNSEISKLIGDSIFVLKSESENLSKNVLEISQLTDDNNKRKAS